MKAQTWTVVSTNMSFRASMFGADVEGTLKGFKGSVIFDPAHPESAAISGSVDAATVFTDNSLRDRHLKEKDNFFEVAKYPRISMKSTKIVKTAAGFSGTFDFTLKSVTKSIEIPFIFSKTGQNATIKAATNLNRKDWKFGGNTFGMSDNVTINIALNLTSPSL